MVHLLESNQDIVDILCLSQPLARHDTVNKKHLSLLMIQYSNNTFQYQVMMNPVCVCVCAPVCGQLLPGEEHVCLLPEHPASEIGTLRVRPAPPDSQHTV